MRLKWRSQLHRTSRHQFCYFNWLCVKPVLPSRIKVNFPDNENFYFQTSTVGRAWSFFLYFSSVQFVLLHFVHLIYTKILHNISAVSNNSQSLFCSLLDTGYNSIEKRKCFPNEQNKFVYRSGGAHQQTTKKMKFSLNFIKSQSSKFSQNVSLSLCVSVNYMAGINSNRSFRSPHHIRQWNHSTVPRFVEMWAVSLYRRPSKPSEVNRKCYPDRVPVAAA